MDGKCEWDDDDDAVVDAVVQWEEGERRGVWDRGWIIYAQGGFKLIRINPKLATPFPAGKWSHSHRRSIASRISLSIALVSPAQAWR